MVNPVCQRRDGVRYMTSRRDTSGGPRLRFGICSLDATIRYLQGM